MILMLLSNAVFKFDFPLIHCYVYTYILISNTDLRVYDLPKLTSPNISIIDFFDLCTQITLSVNHVEQLRQTFFFLYVCYIFSIFPALLH